VAHDVGGVAAQRGERRAQLVRGIGDEALERSSDASIAFRVAASSPTSSSEAGAGSRSEASPLRSIARAPEERRRTGASARRVSSVASRAASAAAASAQPRMMRRVVASVSSMSLVVPATTTAPPAAAPDPSSPSGAA
jgi:hypothetical protein